MISLWVFPRGWCSNGGKSELAEILTIPRSVSSIHQQGTAPTADGGTEAVAVICVNPLVSQEEKVPQPLPGSWCPKPADPLGGVVRALCALD